MANRLFLEGERAYTGKCEIRFRKPAPVGEQILLEGELLERRGRRAILQGRAWSVAGELLADATATFIVIPD
jgi:acyl-coenzyme A thioesterase PaaI-like protein